MPQHIALRIEQDSPTACRVLVDVGVVAVGPTRLNAHETKELEGLVERLVELVVNADERSRLV